jgi:hypothetical protein
MGAYEYVESAPLVLTGSIANSINPNHEGALSITSQSYILNKNTT